SKKSITSSTHSTQTAEPSKQICIQPAKRLLAALGYAVTEVDSGCCGMAGSFGYEVEHVAISRQMGERRLLPAVRAAQGSTVVAAGTSCRHQILEETGVRGLHSAEVVWRAMQQSTNDS
ncbi:MAG: hypothetical protein KAG66_18135, partial [Methylococcales bacterium]|nr:hypothetical protein [Methylococcales bacterium]